MTKYNPQELMYLHCKTCIKLGAKEKLACGVNKKGEMLLVCEKCKQLVYAKK